MSTRLTCVECHQPIRNRKTVIRSRSLRQVAFCASCRTVRTIVAVFRTAA
jgi:hypothetical protein